MAKTFEIVRTQRSLPGVGAGVTGDVRFDTGAAGTARAIGAFGQGAFNLGATMLKIQADREFSEATLDARRQVNQMSVFIKGNHDVEAIADEQDLLLDGLQDREFKSGLAARNYQTWLNNALPGIEQGIRNQVRRVQVDDWHALGSELQAEAIRTGNVSAVMEYYRDGVKNGTISNTDATNLIRQTQHDASLRAAQEFAWRSPEEVLQRLRDNPAGLKEFPILTDPDDWARVRNFAVMRKNDLANKFDSAQIQENQGLWDLLQKKETTTKDILGFIDGMGTATPSEKQTLFKSSSATFKAIQAGRGNPLMVRQNGAKYWELYQATVDGTATEKDWRKAVNKGQITVNDYKEGVNIIEDLTPKDQVADQVEAGRDLDRYINAIRVTRFRGTALESARLKGQRWLEDKIKESRIAGRPLTGTALDAEVIRIGRRVEWEIDNLEAEEIFPTPGVDSQEFNRRTALEPIPVPVLQTITTQAEFNKLPSGTEFIDANDGKRYRKP